ncbi:MAG TPA: hypothetical protein VMZ00_01475, partial [Sporichthya sp.]|nr:hypothetical protein [Sporichthya sp.]
MSARHKRGQFAASRRRVAATAVVTVLTPAAGTLGVGTAFAADEPTAPATQADFGSGTFKGQASADGIRATVAVKDYLIVEDFLDGGGPTAQAGLDSLGESTAFSSLPYPGATGVAFPGLVSTLSGKSVPSYPFYVSSQNPSNPEVTVRQPGYLMHAESTADRSAAQTEAGATTTNGEEFGSFSTASVEFLGGTVTSLGEARSRLAVGAFELNGSFSRAVVSVAPGGKVTKTSSFEASAIHLGTLVIGVTDKGLVAGPQGAPLDPARQISQAITESGVTVKFLPAVETADSVLSSGLEISMERAIPNVGSAKGVVSYIVGRTFAQADAAGFTAGAGTGTPATGVDAAAVPPAAVLPTIGADAASLPGVVAPGSAVGTAPGAAPVPTVNIANASAALQPNLTEISFYPILAAIVPILLLAAVGARRFV